MVSLSLERAADFCRQLSTSRSFSRSSNSRATFLTSARSSGLSSGAGRVRMSKMTKLLLGHVLADVPLLLFDKLRLSFSNSSNSSSMLRLPAL